MAGSIESPVMRKMCQEPFLSFCADACTQGDVILRRRKEPILHANLRRHPGPLLVAYSTNPAGTYALLAR